MPKDAAIRWVLLHIDCAWSYACVVKRLGLVVAVALILAISAVAQASEPPLTFPQAHHAFAIYERPILRPGDSYRLTNCRRFSRTAIVCRIRMEFDVHSKVKLDGTVVRIVGAEYVGHQLVRRKDGKIMVASSSVTVRLPR